MAQEREALYLEFFGAVTKGAADGEMAAAARIHAASQTTWQAAAWLLERRYPDKWGARHRLEHTGKDGGPVKTEQKTTLTVEQANEIVRLARQADERSQLAEERTGEQPPTLAAPSLREP